MKAQVESPATASSPNSPTNTNNNVVGLRVVQDGRVHKTKPRKEEENEEIKLYLAKLQDLVPFMPKHKKLSKLEVIQYVIDYIRDLRQTLGMPPSVVPTAPRIPSVHRRHHNSTPCTPLNDNSVNLMDYVMSTSTTTPIADNVSSNSSHSHHHQQRQPLGVIPTPPNSSAFIPNAVSNCSTQEHQHNNNQIPHQLMDKSPSSDIDTRPVSC